MEMNPEHPMMGVPLTVSVEKAAEMFGISRSSGYRGVARGEIPAVRIGGRIRVPTAKLLAMLGLDGPGMAAGFLRDNAEETPGQAANSNGTSTATPNRSVNGDKSTPSPRA